MALVEQISNIVNDAFADAIGNNASLTKIDTSDFVSLGKAIDDFDLYEPWFKSLANRIAKTVYAVRRYETKKRSVLRDMYEYGAFIQKVYYKMPEAVDNATWGIPNPDTGAYEQASPYDVEGTIAVSTLVFGGKGTWAIEVLRPVEQIKGAFVSAEAMNAFIDGFYTTIDNAYELEEEAITASAVNTAIALALKNGLGFDVLGEYNLLHSDAPLTKEEALESPAFHKYVSKEIGDTIGNMEKMSTVFNAGGHETFTTRDNLVVEMLSKFASASDVYLQADTFHNELTSLPNFEKVAFWQSSGKRFAFDDCSKIYIENDALALDENDTGEVEQNGIICFMHDIENVACHFGNHRTWEMFNPRSEVMIHGEKAEEGFAVDKNANGIVFYMEGYGALTVSAEHATVTKNVAYVNKYTPITFTVAPAEGYTVSSVTAGSTVLTPDEDGVYTYRPTTNNDLTITVTTTS